MAATNGSNLFTYELSISSISPTTGSIGGGSLITVTGVNFSPDPLDNLVFIGDQLNQLCIIETVTTTQITCRTPSKDEFYPTGIALHVILNSKLIMESVCTGVCNFTFIDTNTPNITDLSSAVVTIEDVTITGTSLTTTNNCSIVLTN